MILRSMLRPSHRSFARLPQYILSCLLDTDSQARKFRLIPATKNHPAVHWVLAGSATDIQTSQYEYSPNLADWISRVYIAVFPILADSVDVKRGDQQCEAASQPSTQPNTVDRPMGS